MDKVENFSIFALGNVIKHKNRKKMNDIIGSFEMNKIGYILVMGIFLISFIRWICKTDFSKISWKCIPEMLSSFLNNFLFSCLLSFLVIVIIFFFTFRRGNSQIVSEKNLPIYSISLNDGYNVNGEFILGSGSISGESSPTYRFYIENENGEYSLMEVDARKFNIVMVDTVAPFVHIDGTKKLFNPMRIFVNPVVLNI